MVIVSLEVTAVLITRLSEIKVKFMRCYVLNTKKYDKTPKNTFGFIIFSIGVVQ